MPEPDALLAEVKRLEATITTGPWAWWERQARALLPALIRRLEAGPCIHIPLSHEPMDCGHCPCEQVTLETDAPDQRTGPCSCCGQVADLERRLAEAEERAKFWREKDGRTAQMAQEFHDKLAEAERERDEAAGLLRLIATETLGNEADEYVSVPSAYVREAARKWLT